MIETKAGNLKFETTGRIIKRYAGHIGICETSEGFDIAEGYDNHMEFAGKMLFSGVSYETLDPSERRELADYMIDMWRRFGYE